ncbi:MAG: hypothetical protein A2W91_19990 [Bacteroidetes bacterium GWF2_38_335]|nr:MAG: hypothetical protein A2W91_19990 [Bacteroidetes bacterium GWF2_38_335]OFY81999.1 MAG: hypothetical protein A2281_09930 [Bacteroidetes bacterium RIFOXYA12_FULL_38_20]HBS86501.1 hypothetical protein [Bacteroidales bacterium]
MKKFSFLFFALALVSLVSFYSCDDKGDTKETEESQFASPIEYNDFIVGEQEKLMSIIIELNAAFNTGDEATLRDLLSQLQKQSDESLKAIQGVKDYDGDTKLRDAAEDLFKFYKDLFNKEYPMMIDLYLDTTNYEENESKLLEIRDGIVERESKLDEAFYNAQQEFATKHQMTLTENPKAKEFEDATSGGVWADEERSIFLEECQNGLKDQPTIDAEKYCSCMLEKIEIEYPNYMDAQNISQAEMNEWAVDCLK